MAVQEQIEDLPDRRIIRRMDTDAGVQTLSIEWKAGTAEANADTLRARADLALDAMQAHVDRGTFTVAQRDAALLLVLRVCIALTRLTLNRLERD